jgi:hypothetical protein
MVLRCAAATGGLGLGPTWLSATCRISALCAMGSPSWRPCSPGGRGARSGLHPCAEGAPGLLFAAAQAQHCNEGEPPAAHAAQSLSTACWCAAQPAHLRRVEEPHAAAAGPVHRCQRVGAERHHLGCKQLRPHAWRARRAHNAALIGYNLPGRAMGWMGGTAWGSGSFRPRPPRATAAPARPLDAQQGTEGGCALQACRTAVQVG